MNWRGVWAVMLVMALLMVMPKAWGQRPPDQDPMRGLIVDDIVNNWDRSSVPAEIILIPHKTLLAYSADPSMGYGRLHFTCQSSVDPASGKCATADSAENGTGSSAIDLRFVERRSGMTTQIKVIGWLERAESGRACQDYWQPHKRPLWTSYAAPCATPASGTAVTLLVEEVELRRLVAGHWSAQLLLSLKDLSDGVIADYEFRFDLTITDQDAVSIYFPAFEHVSPLVQLNAAYDPIGQTVGGRTVLDMCLYDGLGSQAQYLGVTVRDITGHPPGPSGYSLWHDDGGADDTRRLDYAVSLAHNGATVPMPSGVEQQLHGIDTARLRLVLLPGMNQPVFCVPTPITFDIPRVPISTQQPGTYFGEVQVELRVPTTTP
ncbi:TPA: CfaE/CblD family pilus tip adhesin [Stenotrophomonas maltophilia]